MATQSRENQAPAVALLFESADQSAYLKDALVALGARIVHEGAATQIEPGVLVEAGADVVVVNLDDAVESHLDAIYDALDESSHRVVFNDAEASRGLSGWDQARWARHLAAKLIGDLNVDPPRPEGARAVEPGSVAAAAMAMPSSEPEGAEPDPHSVDPEVPAGAPTEPVRSPAEEEQLASELQALLSESSDLLGEADPGAASASEGVTLAPIESDDDDVAALDADEAAMFARFDEAHQATESAAGDALVDADALFAVTEPGDEGDESVAEPAAGMQEGAPGDEAQPAAEELDAGKIELTLVDFDGGRAEPQDDVAVPADGDAESTVSASADSAPAAPEWGLVDFSLEAESEGAGDASSDESADPNEFGIEKVSAAEYLNPDGGNEAVELPEPKMSLELVSMEEALAPTMGDAGDHESILDLSDGLRRLVVLPVDAADADAVSAFLQALPSLSSTVLLVAVQPSEPVDADAWSIRLGTGVPQTVKAVAPGARLRAGDIAVTTTDAPVRVGRDGRVESVEDPGMTAQLAAASRTFGPDLLVLLFGGRAADVVGALGQVREAGAGVWAHVDSANGVHVAVEAAQSDGLVDHAASARELAGRLAAEAGAS